MRYSVQESLIGSFLMYGREAMDVAQKANLSPDDFENKQCLVAYNSCLKQYASNRPIDLVAIPALTPEIEEAQWWHKCADCAQVVSHIAYAVSLIQQHRRKRVAIDIQKQWSEMLVKTKDDLIDDTLERMESELRLIKKLESPSESMAEMCDKQGRAWESLEYDITRLSWPLGLLNEMVGRVGEDLIYLAAKPGCGKTTFALNWAVMLARDSHRVAFRSLESKVSQLIPRLVAMIGQVDTIPLREHRGDPAHLETAKQTLEYIKTLPLSINDSGATIEQLRAWAMCEKRDGATILFIDNLRHIRPNQNYAGPVEQFRDFSLKLKWLRDDLGLPLIVLHHLNTEGNVAWSRDIDRDVDILVTMEAPEALTEYNPQSANHDTPIKFGVVKNRNGLAGGSLTVLFDKRFQTFREGIE